MALILLPVVPESPDGPGVSDIMLSKFVSMAINYMNDPGSVVQNDLIAISNANF